MTVKEYSEDPMNEKVRLFEIALKKKFPDLRITSRFRPKAFTKSGNLSRHAKGEALDIEGRKDVYDYLWNTEEGITLMYNSGVGILDETNRETMKKTGATGAHYHVGMDSTLVPQMEQRYNELVNQKQNKTNTATKNINPEETFLQPSVELPTFATLPQAQEEKLKESVEKEKSAEEVLDEKQNVKDYTNFLKQNSQIQPQQDQQYVEAPQLNAIDFYNQANQIVGTPQYQQGGIIKLTKNEENFLRVYQKGGVIPVSSDGMYKYPNQKVIVPTDGSITMKQIPYNILAKSLETGETKMLEPNKEYFFKNTKNVLEIPIK